MKKDKSALHFRVAPEAYEAIRALARGRSTSLSRTVSVALDELLGEIERSGGAVSIAPHPGDLSPPVSKMLTVPSAVLDHLTAVSAATRVSRDELVRQALLRLIEPT